MLPLCQTLFHYFHLSTDHFLILIKIHQIIEGNMGFKILEGRASQPLLILAVILWLLNSCLHSVCLKAQIKVMIATQMGLVRICCTMEPVTKYKIPACIYQRMWPTNFCLLLHIAAITVFWRHNAGEILTPTLILLKGWGLKASTCGSPQLSSNIRIAAFHMADKPTWNVIDKYHRGMFHG